MPDTECTHGLICWLQRFGGEWKDLMPLFGSFVVASTAAGVGFFATWYLNRAMKRTEFFLKFTERFHNILQAKHQLELRASEQDEQGNLKLGDARRKIEAHEIYRQFFGLMFDEFFSYKKGFLDRDAFVEWMRWRQYEYSAGHNGDVNFAIAGVSYRDGWTRYCANRIVHPEFQRFMQEIHKLDGTPDLVRTIDRLVLAYANPSERLFGRFRGWLRDYRYVVYFLAGLLLLIGYAWLIS